MIQRTYRATGMGAHNESIFIAGDGAIVRPIREEMSRTGNHGTMWWRESDVAGAIEISIARSNSGKGGWHVPSYESCTPEQRTTIRREIPADDLPFAGWPEVQS